MSVRPPRWTFWDYVSENGVNRISEWLCTLPIEARVEFEALLDTIRAKERLTRPQTGKLYGQCKGLYEFRFKAHNTQYRPIFRYGPDDKEITILAGATKKNNRFDPPNVCRTALDRANQVETDRRQVVKHVRIGR